MSLGPLAFLSPWLLAGLLALPVIWWLLRTIPPRPQRIDFPPTRILVGLENREKTPANTPWWLMLIRMAAAALVIFALAEPVLNPNRETALAGSGPVVLVVDNGWSAAAHWGARASMVDRLITEAEGRGRPVMIVPTASAAKRIGLKVEAPTAARSTAAAVQPQPFGPDRAGAAQAIAGALAGAGDATVVWLTDGIDHDEAARPFADKLAELAGAGFVVIEMRPGQEALGASATVVSGGKLEAQVLRAEGGPRSGILHALSARGQRLGEAPFTLNPGETRAVASFNLPLELRNQVMRIEIAGERSAGAVHLLDARSQWHRVGLFSSELREQAQPLLAPLYYIERALTPFTEIAKGEGANLPAAIDLLIKRNVSVMMLADVGTIPHDIKEQLEEWVKKGGVLVRFAGPRLEKGGDDLLPVSLRLGGRTLGGALSWSTPQPLAPFGDQGLFAGLQAPADVLVTQQVLADPAGLGPDVRVWARLKDGTPLVTASKRGDGQLVFFHITANSDWSNLPLSGLFVEMLRRITTLGKLGGGGGESLAERRHRRCGRRGGAFAIAGARRVRPAEEPAADHAGHRRVQDRRRQAERGEPARLLRPGRRAALAQPHHAQDDPEARGKPARERGAARLRGRCRAASEAAAADCSDGAAVRRHPGRADPAGGRARALHAAHGACCRRARRRGSGGGSADAGRRTCRGAGAASSG